ncbi:hypothetical protein P152DRAFT_491930 [Eremomyces bilateralis CBS 781.70]|uniref:Uncharacterized protein n=1 Tax=Eremomyces bilateralis CBS 781.70 TaxID=1392243 RepID=A0A6G1GDC3_9PEZI|nr:uncharacterized protein P152DRAFT_491930 [Eremomyces bilateralis CBS 781.70]KAF1816048.1 hypothetical protein P152DRAFT_491930 [Eremomyces bilateralis CBS 781.70]
MGGLYIVRRLDFDDGTSWIARLQHKQPTREFLQRLIHEIHAIEVLRGRSKIPVSEIFAYEASNNVAGVAFMIMEFIPADTAIDSFGSYFVHRGKTPPQFKDKFYCAMAGIKVRYQTNTSQVELTVRFPKIGNIIKLPDGTYSTGPIPGIGDPIDTAADFFLVWAEQAKLPPSTKTPFVQERPQNL